MALFRKLWIFLDLVVHKCKQFSLQQVCQDAKQCQCYQHELHKNCVERLSLTLELQEGHGQSRGCSVLSLFNENRGLYLNISSPIFNKMILISYTKEKNSILFVNFNNEYISYFTNHNSFFILMRIIFHLFKALYSLIIIFGTIQLLFILTVSKYLV